MHDKARGESVRDEDYPVAPSWWDGSDREYFIYRHSQRTAGRRFITISTCRNGTRLAGAASAVMVPRRRPNSGPLLDVAKPHPKGRQLALRLWKETDERLDRVAERMQRMYGRRARTAIAALCIRYGLKHFDKVWDDVCKRASEAVKERKRARAAAEVHSNRPAEAGNPSEAGGSAPPNSVTVVTLTPREGTQTQAPAASSCVPQQNWQGTLWQPWEDAILWDEWQTGRIPGTGTRPGAAIAAQKRLPHRTITAVNARAAKIGASNYKGLPPAEWKVWHDAELEKWREHDAKLAEERRALEEVIKRGELGLPVLESVDVIVAYRLWEVRPAGAYTFLESLNVRTVWPANEPLRAHDLTQAERGNGIHALKKALDEAGYRRHYSIDKQQLDRIVYGSVSLWGRVIEHDHGYRAELAYPRHIIVPAGFPDAYAIVRGLVNTYGCEAEVYRGKPPAAV